MKQLLFTLILSALSCLTFAQQIDLGTYEGEGKMQGITCPVKFRFEQSGVAVTFDGICNCVMLLQETETKMLFRETDFLSADGGPRNDSCRSREYIFFSKNGDDITASWGSTPEEALGNKTNAVLIKIK